MSFSAGQKNINEILSRNTIYNIPKNQRKYVWAETEWNELFEDVFLINQAQTYSHFLGSMVFAKEENNNEYSVIDGQQRLTTICLLFLAIINEMYKIGEVKVAESYKNTYLKGNNDGDDYYKVERKDGTFCLIFLVDEISSHIDQTNIKNKYYDCFGKTDKYNEKLLDCYLHLSSKIETELVSKEKKKEYLVSLKDRIINCGIIEIIVEKDVDGYRVFETLNARGIPLEQHELIKNYLYSYLRTKSKISKLDTLWAKIIDNLTFNETDYFSTFISHYCSHIYGKVKNNDEFKTIRSKTPKNNVEDLLISLNLNSVFYSYFIEPTKLKGSEFYDDKAYVSLKYFKDLNIRQVRPLLLSIFEQKNLNKITKDEFIGCITYIETFYFVYSTILKNTTNTIDNAIISLSTRIHDGKYDVCLDTIKNDLTKYVSEKEKAKENFKYIGFSNKNKKFKNSSNKRIVNYIHYKLEKYFDVNDEVEPKITSIEHIMNDSEDNDYASYIGNLLPLSIKINGKISAKPFTDKIIYYKRSKLLTVSDFVRENEAKSFWSETDIENRGKNLSKIAFEHIWVI